MNPFCMLIDYYLYTKCIIFTLQSRPLVMLCELINCQIKRHFTSDTGHSLIIEAKDFIRHNKAVEESERSKEDCEHHFWLSWSLSASYEKQN